MREHQNNACCVFDLNLIIYSSSGGDGGDGGNGGGSLAQSECEFLVVLFEMCATSVHASGVAGRVVVVVVVACLAGEQLPQDRMHARTREHAAI